MKPHVAFPTKQSGFALVAAIFLLVIVGALGAFAERTTLSQQSATDLQLLSARAQEL
jgi:Tfp pilus assembly protein PilX